MARETRMKKRNKISVGVDIEDISRFEELNRVKNRIFLNKIFTKRELDYCFSKARPASHLAARFSGKEAIIKALSSIELNNISYNYIEILNDKQGTPRVHLLGNIKIKSIQIELSLSHCQDKAVAFVVLFNGESNK